MDKTQAGAVNTGVKVFCHFATGVFKQKATHRAAFKHLVYSKELAEFKCSTPPLHSS